MWITVFIDVEKMSEFTYIIIIIVKVMSCGVSLNTQGKNKKMLAHSQGVLIIHF